ncbi:sodium- and chloride-dependent glycine transporter 2-like isoform X2 [Tachypleus tridentatus]|uniref:sodium- and chloride-dependent glycine transporter 2-like isoform X2 n=1 Tax=Tachypleus tridentatus TaxID=6853 RepID=UPI003FD16690
MKVWEHFMKVFRPFRQEHDTKTTPEIGAVASNIKPVVVDDEETAPERGHWTGRYDFILSCLGTAVGLGNVWRFPYLCYRNGGGAFLIPYILMVFLVGLPVFLVELALGQYSALGPLNVFKNLSPLFRGLGLAQVLAAAMVAIYYNVIISWTLFYFFDSFRSQVPWKLCDYWFNTESCFADQDWSACKEADPNNTFFNRTCFNATYSAVHNLTDIPENKRVSAPEEYFNHYMLGKSDGFHDIGTIRWQLLLPLLGAWVVVAGCLIKGIKTSGRVWEDAAIQVFYSFSIAGGGMITYASYNKFTNNLVKDALIIGIGDMLTSIFSGMVVFSMLGFMAHQLKKSVADVVESGTGLAFIAYPDGISRMPVSILWALLFFFMLFLLGIDSQFAMVETIITFVFDQFPKTRAFKPTVVITISLVLFLFGLPLTTNGGVYILEVIDAYAAGWPYMFIGLLECLVVAYVYGVENFLSDLKQMTGWCPGLWVRTHLITVIMTVSPILISFILLLSWIQFEPLKLGEYVFPPEGNAIGWVLAFIPIVCVPIGALWEIFKHRSIPIKDRLQLLLASTPTWRENASRNTHQELEEVLPTVTMGQN